MDVDRLKRAMAFKEAGKEEDALREFETLAELVSNASEKCGMLVQQASSLWRLGRLDEARRRLTEATQYEKSLYTELMDACLCLAEGQNEEALRKLTVFLEGHPGLRGSNDSEFYFDARENLGMALFAL